MENTIRVNENIWNWIISAVPSLSEGNIEKLLAWKSGKKQPTFNQLEKFSNTTHIPFGYFFLNSPPDEKLDILEFRTVDSLKLRYPSRDLTDTVRQMEDIQEWMREFIIFNQGEKNSFVGSLDINGSVSEMTDIIRSKLGLSVEWYRKVDNIDDSFRQLKLRISNSGTLVIQNGIVGVNTRRSLDIDEFRAFTLIDEYAPLIFINSKDSKGGLIFSLLHEFAHIGIGKNSFFNAAAGNSNFVNPYEKFCNAIAAEVLVPDSVFTRQWAAEDGDPNEKILSLSSYFRCSTAVIARRALNRNFIPLSLYKNIIDEAIEAYKNRPKPSGGDIYKNQAARYDRRFLFALNSSLNEGRTLYSDAFRLTKTNRKTYDGLISEIRGERK